MPVLREITLDGFGQTVLEEILFRAGEIAHESDGEAVELEITFRVTADGERDALAVSLPPVVEGGQGFVTHLPRPF